MRFSDQGMQVWPAGGRDGAGLHIRYDVAISHVFFVRACLTTLWWCSGHSQAVELTGWIHGDVSLSNIMVYPYTTVSETGGTVVRFKGVLIDWELSRPVDMPEIPSVSERLMKQVSSKFPVIF